MSKCPSDRDKGNIVKIPKKGDLLICDDCCGVILTAVPAKVLGLIIFARITASVEELLKEEQAGFGIGRSCCDQIYVLNNVIQQCTEWQKSLVLNFIDFEKTILLYT